MPKQFEEMVKSIKKSCAKQGVSSDKCNSIAYGTATNYAKKHHKPYRE